MCRNKSTPIKCPAFAANNIIKYLPKQLSANLEISSAQLEILLKLSVILFVPPVVHAQPVCKIRCG